MVVRGFNTNAETNLILEENDIPKMGFSKFMNTVVKEWHIGQKESKEIPRSEGKIIGVKI